MKTAPMKKFIFLLVFAFAPAAVMGAGQAVYGESADARQGIAAALKTARDTNKTALVVFGANWCGDCKVLDMEMHRGDLAKLVDDKFVVVKVDVGRFDKNKDINAQYGEPIKKGIPSVVMLRKDGTAFYKTDGGELADARKMGQDGIYRFFTAMVKEK